MRQLKSIALVLLVFCGSAGIPLYQHTCLHEDITINTLFTGSDHCKATHEPEQVIESCCGGKTKEQLTDNHCCTEDVARLAMNFGFFENWQLTPAVIPQRELSIARFLPFQPVFPVEKSLLYASDKDPPSISGRERLHRICTWRL